MDNEHRPNRETEEPMEAGDIRLKEDRPVSWIENFWYHYKIPTVIVLFFLVVVVICAFQMCSNRDYDGTVVYAGPYQFTANEKRDIENILSSVLEKDINRDGAALYALVNYQVASQEEIESSEGSIGSSYSSSQFSTYSNYLLTGDASICILSGYLYEQLRSNNRLLPLADVSAAAAQKSEDGTGIRFGSTKLYAQSKVLQNLPEDTYLCILRPTIVGRSSKTEYFSQIKEAFVKAVG